MKKTNTATPVPGSREAIHQGCLCPVIDNGGGKGVWIHQPDNTSQTLFWIATNCPLHGRVKHLLVDQEKSKQ